MATTPGLPVAFLTDWGRGLLIGEFDEYVKEVIHLSEMS